MKKSNLITAVLLTALLIALLMAMNLTFISYNKAKINETNANNAIRANADNIISKMAENSDNIIVKPIPGMPAGSISLEEAKKLNLILEK